MKPLSTISIGSRVRIAKITGGRGVVFKLRNMGIIEGEEIKVMNNHFGSLIVSHGNTRYAIGRGMSHKVLVDDTDTK